MLLTQSMSSGQSAVDFFFLFDLLCLFASAPEKKGWSLTKLEFREALESYIINPLSLKFSFEFEKDLAASPW